MPFTFSHPAIILPFVSLKKKWLSATGLIVGSMIPDFEYFIRMKDKSIYSHTLAGLCWFDLPLGILVCFIYHNFVRDPFIDNSLKLVKERLIPYKGFNWTGYFKRYWLVVCVSILIGGASHILWDDFTHERGYFVKHIPFLRMWIDTRLITIHLYNLAQLLSSILGVFVITIAFLKLKAYAVIKDSNIYKYWLLVSAISLITIMLRIACGLDLHKYGNVIVSVIAAGMIALIVTPLILQKLSTGSLLKSKKNPLHF